MKANKIRSGLLYLLRAEAAHGSNGKPKDGFEDESLRRLVSHLAMRELIEHAQPAMTEVSDGEQQHLAGEMLDAFLNGDLDSKKAESIRKHLQTCSDCFVRMARKQKELKDSKKSRVQTQRLAAIKEAVFDFAAYPIEVGENIMNWATNHPAWGFSSLGIAVAAIVLFVLLWPASPVENISSGHHLVITDQGPLGFVPEQEVREYDGMSVSLSEDGENIVFHWKEVPEGSFERIILWAGVKRRVIPLNHDEEGDNSFAMPAREIKRGVRYTWELRGKLKDGRVFSAQSQFVYRK